MQPGMWTLMVMDLLQLSQLVLYNDTGSTGTLTFNNQDIIHPRLPQLTKELHLAHMHQTTM
jgi:hypothetical protein